MKFLAPIILIILSASVEALTCSTYVPPNGEKIAMQNDAGVTYFSLPASLDGHQLRSVTLWAYPIDKKSPGELAAPLAFKVANGVGKGHFAITAKFVNAEITAAYTEDVCGPRLESSVGI
ncbi:hypothetical protein [Microbulbifer aestuariivivens]|uniref:hypothetical protein n=1 Tax=Microbulbifer aestuariivivens TaxID=1908308 RepID=UPI0031E5172F